jgi:hypothetical protein
MKKGIVKKRGRHFDLFDLADNIIASTDMDACDYYNNDYISWLKGDIKEGSVLWKDTSYIVDAGDNGVRVKQVII